MAMAIPLKINSIFPHNIVAGKLNVSKITRDKLTEYIQKRKDSFKKINKDKVNFEKSPMHFHNKDKFHEIFESIGELVNQSVINLGFRPSYLEFYIVRSWANFNIPGMATSAHSHLNSHISIVYYPDNSCSNVPISFHGGQDNCWIPVLNTQPYANINVYDDKNYHSANTISITPEENLCLIFPSYIVHGVPHNNNKEPRISLAMDGLFTLKQYESDEPLLPPVSQWKKLALK